MKTTKKTAGPATRLMLLAMMAGFATVAAPAEGNIIYSDSFEHFAPGTRLDTLGTYSPEIGLANRSSFTLFESMPPAPAAGSITAVMRGSGPEVAALFLLPTGTGGEYRGEFGATLTGQISIEWRVQLDELATSGGTVGFFLRLPAVEPFGLQVLVGLLTDGRVVTFSDVPALSTIVNVTTVSFSVGHTLRVDVDLAARLYSIFVDGTPTSVSGLALPPYVVTTNFDVFGFDVNAIPGETLPVAAWSLDHVIVRRTAGMPRSRLLNISTRGFVGVGESIMIPGFVVSSEGVVSLLVRAVGPSLAGFGVVGFLADPQLVLFRQESDGSSTQLAFNDDWGLVADPAASTAAAAAAGAFALPAGSKDAAIVIQLLPGVYTVQASGVGGATGAALLEVYELE